MDKSTTLRLIGLFLFLGVLFANLVNMKIKSGWGLVLLIIAPGIVWILLKPRVDRIVTDFFIGASFGVIVSAFFIGASFTAIILGMRMLIKKKKK